MQTHFRKRSTVKSVAFVSLFFVSSTGWGYANIISPIPSTFTQVSTPNTHLIDETPQSVVLRGGTPKNEADIISLKKFGIKRVLIFKDEINSEVRQETAALENLGYRSDQIRHIPFQWRNFHSFKEQCERTLQGLREIDSALKDQSSLYIHCTVGEDRTGMLAAFWKLRKNRYSKMIRLFEDEMCKYGYDASDVTKPEWVLLGLRSYLTPFFIEMYEFLKSQADKELSEIKCPVREFAPENKTLFTCGGSF